MEHTDHSAYTVAIANTKGGVGKTTTTANLAALCADLGQRVLMIDCDKQGSLSKYFGLQTRAPNGLSYALTRRRIDGTCISSTNIERLDLIRHDDAMSALTLLRRRQTTVTHVRTMMVVAPKPSVACSCTLSFESKSSCKNKKSN